MFITLLNIYYSKQQQQWLKKAIPSPPTPIALNSVIKQGTSKKNKLESIFNNTKKNIETRKKKKKATCLFLQTEKCRPEQVYYVVPATSKISNMADARRAGKYL